MPELPEVETVRDGLARWVAGRTIDTVEVHHPRAIRRHVAGAADFAAQLAGRRVDAVRRRGKYLWAELSSPAQPGGVGGACLIGHLGMSGQLLVQPADAPDETHLRVRLRFTDDAAGDTAAKGRELRFVDQRTFGGLIVDTLVPTPDDPADTVPSLIAHIGRDPLDPRFDPTAWSRRLRAKHTEIKRALLDQSLSSGIGNIYADESLWRAKLHGRRATDALSAAVVRGLLGHVRDVLSESLRAGGTSFDALYVNVNGQSGWFDRSLSAYGQEGRPCPRCGTTIRRESFMNRSSFYCPRCQRAPRRAAA